jgi:hypothetical protein
MKIQAYEPLLFWSLALGTGLMWTIFLIASYNGYTHYTNNYNEFWFELPLPLTFLYLCGRRMRKEKRGWGGGE